MKKENVISLLAKIFILAAIVFSPLLIVNGGVIFAWDIAFKNYAIPLKILVIVAYLSIIACTFVDQFSKNKYVDFFNLILIIGTTVIFAFIKSVFEDNADEELLSLYIGPSIIIGMVFSAYLFIKGCRRSFDKLNFNIGDMIEIAMFCAMAIILDLTFFKIRIGENGGSISLVMLPLAVMSYRKGIVKGFIGCGIVFGFLSCLIDGYGLVTYPLDYLGAFGSIGIVGLYKTLKFEKYNLIVQEIAIAVLFVIAVAFRTLFATISGMVLYGLDFVGSFSYNIAYILPSSIMVLVILVLLFKPINKLFERKTN